jgi:hypothetical protein
MGKMDWLLLFHASYCTLHHVAHTWSYTIDLAESVVEELTELAPAEESANTELTKGKHWCIPSVILDFCFNHYFMLCILVH